MRPPAWVARLAGEERRQLRDAIIGGVFAVGLIVDPIASGTVRGPVAVNVLVGLAIGAALAVRRRAPLPVLLVTMGLAVIKQAWLAPTASGIFTVVVVFIVNYTCGRWSDSRAAGVGLAFSVAAATTISVINSGVGDIAFPVVFFVFAPWLAGRGIRARTLLARELEERASRLEHERAEAARRAVADERRRIARELHDVVAHSISVMVIQAGAGRRVIMDDADQAAACAELIERVGRDALNEMRRLVGVMEGDGERQADRAPQPGLDRVGDLVQRARAAGLPVELRIEGEPADLSAGIGLTAYRIVQEALTNTLKHAGRAHARVVVRYGEDDVELEISDDGHPKQTPAVNGSGHGLVGMRERVAVYGGEVTAGPREGGGFAVRARLPLHSGAERPVAA